MSRVAPQGRQQGTEDISSLLTRTNLAEGVGSLPPRSITRKASLSSIASSRRSRGKARAGTSTDIPSDPPTVRFLALDCLANLLADPPTSKQAFSGDHLH